MIEYFEISGLNDTISMVLKKLLVDNRVFLSKGVLYYLVLRNKSSRPEDEIIDRISTICESISNKQLSTIPQESIVSIVMFKNGEVVPMTVFVYMNNDSIFVCNKTENNSSDDTESLGSMPLQSIAYSEKNGFINLNDEFSLNSSATILCSPTVFDRYIASTRFSVSHGETDNDRFNEILRQIIQKIVPENTVFIPISIDSSKAQRKTVMLKVQSSNNEIIIDVP